MVVRLFGGGSKSQPAPDPDLDPRDPDPRQLVMAWDQEAREKAGSARAAKKTKAVPKTAASKDSKPSRGAKDIPPAKPASPTTKSTASAAKTTAGRVKASTGAATPTLFDEPKATLRNGAATGGRVATTVADPASEVSVEIPAQQRSAPAISTANSHAAVSGQPEAVAGNGRNGNGNGNGSDDSASYTGDQIQILEGVQHIRQRPGMYIGTTSTSGLLHLVYEAIDNVVDEFNAGYGTSMEVTIDSDGRVTVKDEA
ncbi:MAG TPA: hypothetical protein VHS06_05110, partial [Chloroflexota bacterium]|nr:hypothetical protein [Chloroflexota bacterium]